MKPTTQTGPLLPAKPRPILESRQRSMAGAAYAATRDVRVVTNCRFGWFPSVSDASCFEGLCPGNAGGSQAPNETPPIPSPLTGIGGGGGKSDALAPFCSPLFFMVPPSTDPVRSQCLGRSPGWCWSGEPAQFSPCPPLEVRAIGARASAPPGQPTIDSVLETASDVLVR